MSSFEWAIYCVGELFRNLRIFYIENRSQVWAYRYEISRPYFSAPIDSEYHL